MFWSRLFGREKREEPPSSVTPQVDTLLLEVLADDTKMNAERALEIPAFSAAVDYIAGIVSMLTIKLCRENADTREIEEIANDERLFLLNDEANPMMTALEVKREQIRDMLIHGVGYVYIDKIRGRVRSLRYVKSSDVFVNISPDPIFKDAYVYVGERRYNPWDFIAFTRNTKDGVTGIGAVEEHKTLLSAMYAALKYENAISRTGGNKKGFLQSEKTLTDEALTKLRTAWNELYANNENNMMVLNNGIKYVPSASTSVEMQMNENKRTNEELITQIFGLTPEVVSGAADEKTTAAAMKTAVLPVAAAYQSVLNRVMLTEREKAENYYFVLDTTDILKADVLSRYQAYAVALQNNFMQIDEVRYLEDRKPLGFNYIKLGLQDVLLDPKTGDVYTPNTNQLVNVGSEKNLLTNSGDDDIIEGEEIRKKTNWVKGSKGLFVGSLPNGMGGKEKMTRSEFNEVSSCIASIHPLYKTGETHGFYHGDYYYRFEVLGCNEYIFTLKTEVKGNRELANLVKEIYGDD